MAPNHFAEHRIFERASLVVAMSSVAARSVLEEYHADPTKVLTIHPPAPLRQFEPSRLRMEDPGPLRVLFVGNDVARKRADLIAAAVTGLGDRAILNLVSNDSAALKLANQNVVVHAGVEAYSRKWLELFRTSDVFAMVSPWEAFGMVYLEAMAASLPIVMGSSSAAPDLINRGTVSS
jgi:glycosyltransferase involved in cell wall biosynthesis